MSDVAYIYANGNGYTPTLVLDYEESRTGGNVLHTVIGRPDPDVTLRAAGLKHGSLRLFFTSNATARACANDLAVAGVHYWEDVTASIDFSFVVDGDVRLRAEDETGAVWVVEVEYQEVTP